MKPMYARVWKNDYEMRFLSGARNERKAYQNVSNSKLFLRVINEAVLFHRIKYFPQTIFSKM